MDSLIFLMIVQQLVLKIALIANFSFFLAWPFKKFWNKILSVKFGIKEVSFEESFLALLIVSIVKAILL